MFEGFDLGLELTHPEGDFVLVGDGGVELFVGGEFGAVGLLEGCFFGGFFREFAVGEVFGAEEEVEFFAEFAGDLGFELGVGEALLALGEGGGVGFGSVADADDVEDGVTVGDFIAEHVFDFAVVGGEVGLLDGGGSRWRGGRAWRVHGSDPGRRRWRKRRCRGVW